MHSSVYRQSGTLVVMVRPEVHALRAVYRTCRGRGGRATEGGKTGPCTSRRSIRSVRIVLVYQEVVAVNCKIASGTYRRYEKGEREPSLSTLCTFADYFGVTLDQLAGRAPLPAQEP